MAEPTEIFKAAKQGLDVFLDGDDAAFYAKPEWTPEQMVQRGLVDDAGNATSKGVLFTDLQDAGIFGQDGTLTPRGAAYAMPADQALQFENLEAFKIRKQGGVDDEDASFGQMVGAVGEFVGDAAKGLGRRMWEESKIGTPWENEDALIASGAAIADGSINATKSLFGGMLPMGVAWVDKLTSDDADADEQLWIARQDFARQQREQQTAAVGQALEDTGLVANVVSDVARAKEVLPKDEYDRIVKEGNALGQFVDPTVMIPMGVAAKAGKASVVSRAALKADRVLADVAKLDAKIAARGVELAATQRAATTAGNASTLAGKMSDELATRFAATGDQVAMQRTRQASEIAARTTAAAAQQSERAAGLAGELSELTARRQSLATRLPESAAGAVAKAIEIGRNAPAAPVRMFAAASDAVGDSLIKIDDVLSGVSQAYGGEAARKVFQWASRGGAVAGLAAGGPTGLAAGIGAAGAIRAATKTGPIFKQSARFAEIVGKEMTRARGQVPYWQRVANYPDLSPAHRGLARMMDTATMGGAATGAIRRATKGFSAAYPIDLAFEVLADGGDPNANTFKRAAAESLVLGGSSGMLGGMFQGTKARHRQLALGDELNFKQDITDPGQREVYNSLPPGVRRSLATYSASNPQLRFRFTEDGPSSLSGNVATINTRSDNPMRPLIAHEVMHHVVIRNQMEDGVSAMLIGDGESGGLLRSNDGSLDPSFKDFWDTYNARLAAIGEEPVTMQQAALEYYVDAASDQVAGMAESGELGSMAGRTDARRAISGIVSATFSKIPIIRDLHFKMGGLLDGENRFVQGNGLLSDGLRDLPEARRMTRELLKRSAGRSQGLFEAVGASRKNDGGAAIPVRKEDKVLLEKIGVSAFERETGPDGRERNRLDPNGEPIPLSKETEMKRENIGKVILEAVRKKKDASGRFLPGELDIDDEGNITGSHLGEDSIRSIREQGILNAEQLRILRNVNGALKNFDGSRFVVINHPATKKDKKGRVRYDSLAPTLREVVPVKMEITQKGNLLVGLMSVTQLHANIEARLESKHGRRLYQGNREALMNDVGEVMKIHREGGRTDAYFDEKYGAIKGPEYKNFILTIFGLMNKDQANLNPVFAEDGVGYKDNVYKTYRIDRISQATRMDGNTHIPMPFVYDSVRANLMPNGLPTLDAQGNPTTQP